MSRDRRELEELVKNWAQSHSLSFTIKDLTPGDDGVLRTQSHLTWIIQERYAIIDLLTLVDRLETFVADVRKQRVSDIGLYCTACGTYCQFAEPNKDDGSFICYSCRSPYH